MSAAEKRLERLEDEIALLEAKYTAYKSNFCSLLKKQFEFLGEQDLMVDLAVAIQPAQALYIHNL